MFESDPSKVPATTDELEGTSIGGKYQVVQRVARSGMSRIYLAVQEPLGRPVALKVFDPPIDHEEEVREFRERFLREAAIVARLRHPNTVMIHDYGVMPVSHALYMVMEWVEGRNLLEEIQEYGPLPPERAVRIAHEVARSLQEAHGVGIIHRDVKSANVMLTRTEEGETVKVIDFGIARVEDLDTMSGSDHVLGTARYMSPEQIARTPMDARSDLYSLGVVLFEMLTGQPPFKGTSIFETMMAHVRDEPPRVEAMVPHPILDSLVRVVDLCLAKSPDDRPASAAALRHLLDLALSDMMSGTHSDVMTLATAERAGHPRPPADSRPRALGTVDGSAPSSLDSVASLAAADRAGHPRPRSRWAPSLNAFVLLAILVVGGGSAFACVGVALSWVAAGMPDPRTAIVRPTPPVQLAPPAEVPVALTLESTPLGAEVFEDERSLGKTPLSIALGSSSATPVRHLELRLEGYEPESVWQGPSAEPVAIEVALRPSPESAPTRKPSTPRGAPEGPFMLER